MAKALFLPSYPDFQTYYNAAHGFFSGKNLYTIPSPFSSSFVYPPFALLFMIPIALFPITIAGNIWTFFSLLAFICSIYLLLQTENETPFSNRFLLFFALAFFSFPAKFTLGMGQINMFVLLCIALSMYWYKKSKFTLANGVLSVSLATKLFPLFLLLIFIVKKQWKNLFQITFFLFGFWALSTLVFSPHVFFYYWRTIFPTIAHATRTDYYNQALSGFVFHVFGVSDISQTMVLSFTIFIILISFFVVWRIKHASFHLIAGFLITVQLLINTFSEQHHFVWLLVPYFQFTYLLIKKKSNLWKFFPLIISGILTQSNIKHPDMFPALFQPHVFYGTLILWGYIIYLLRYDKHSFSH